MHTLINNRLLIKTAKCLMVMLIASFAFTTTLSAAELDKSENALLAQVNKKKTGKKSNCYEAVNCWKPYFTWIGNVQDQQKRSFVQFDLGLGFLYFSKINGNLIPAPSGAGSLNNGLFIPFEGEMNYNRTLVYQYSAGYRVFNWFKVALAIESQTGISVQTDMLNSKTVNAGGVQGLAPPQVQLRANLALNAVFPKFTFELPWVMIWKNWLYTPYLNLGIGPCWQSWTDVRLYEQYVIAGLEDTFVNTLSQKYPASAFWQVDLGIRSKMACLPSTLSFSAGCKFSSWGQVRNIGDVRQQGSWGYALAKPFRARMLYSFAPYLGVQWNF